ncbi:MAG: tRNA lysidine(34) synthetase TilS [Actinomycetaceae bacterium]|nr:tRNA lysidine(34) synthetase TilS [Actinomycetaceae bacterium]MDY6083488.1 tRNA lysidine(34) synthetase TilS [Actinomycetaceae bacterium]
MLDPSIAAVRNAVRASLLHTGVIAIDHKVADPPPLLVALSGGSDSTALALASLWVARKYGLRIGTVTVLHGINNDLDQAEERVARWAQQVGFDAVYVPRVNLGMPGNAENNGWARKNHGPEGEARNARYQAIAESAMTMGAEMAAGRPAQVLLGHTADDQAETVLLGLSRGSGAHSLRGMPAVGVLPGHPEVAAQRPLLGLRRSLLRDSLRAQGTSWLEDPSNGPQTEWRSASGRPLTRNGIRNRVIPALREVFGSGVPEALVRTAALLAADDDALNERADAVFESLAVLDRGSDAGSGSDRIVLGRADLAQHPKAIRTRVVARALRRLGGRNVMFDHLVHVDDLVVGAGGGRVYDVSGVHVFQDGGSLICERIQ